MSETRYIIEYLPGCKGDMITGLLNHENLSVNSLKKVDREELISLKDISNPVHLIYPSLNEFEDKIKTITKKFTTSHGLYFLNQSYYDILDFFNIKIIKIIFEKKYFQTIKVEGLFKNLRSRNKVLDQRLGFSRQEDQDFFLIDYHLKEKNIPLTDKNRAEMLYSLLTVNEDFKKERVFNSVKQNQNKILWSYHNLYIDIDPNHEIFETIDLGSYKIIVEKSWLPDEIYAFGKIWKPRDYGYRSF